MMWDFTRPGLKFILHLFSKRALHFQSGWCQGMGSGCPEALPWPRAAVGCAKCICQAASLPCWTHQTLSSSPLTPCSVWRSSSLAWTFVKVQKIIIIKKKSTFSTQAVLWVNMYCIQDWWQLSHDRIFLCSCCSSLLEPAGRVTGCGIEDLDFQS